MKYISVPEIQSRDISENDGYPMLPHLKVFDACDGPVDTGILDIGGRKIYRIEEKMRIWYV